MNREIVIERIMALEEDDIDLEQVKWVVLMVLFNMPGQEGPYAWMEDYMFEEQVGLFH
jgi:Smg protein